MQGSRAENEESRQCYPPPIYGILHFDYHCSRSIFFFVCMIVANAEILHSGLIWKATTGCILMAVSGIGITVAIQKFLDRGK